MSRLLSGRISNTNFRKNYSKKRKKCNDTELNKTSKKFSKRLIKLTRKMRCLTIFYKQAIYFFSITIFKNEFTVAPTMSFQSPIEPGPEAYLKLLKTRPSKISATALLQHLSLQLHNLLRKTRKKPSAVISFLTSIYSEWTLIIIGQATLSMTHHFSAMAAARI